MTTTVAISVAATLAAAVQARLEVGVRGETRAVGLAPEGEDAVGRAAAELTPRAELIVEGAPLSARAGWSSRLSVPDLTASTEPDVTHQAELRVEARPRTPVVVTLSGAATRGRTDPLADLWTEVGLADPTTVAPTSVPFESARAALDAAWEFTRRDVLTGAASVFATRGTDTAARLVLPLQRSVSAEATYGRRVAPRDLARLSVLASGTRTEPGLDAAWLVPSAEWRRQLTRALEGFASGGASLTFEDTPTEPPRRDAAPVAAAGLAYAGSPVHAEELTLRSTPSVHRLGGEIQQVLSATAAVRWFPRPRWTLLASVTGAQAWRGPDLRLAALSARAAWRPRERLTLEIGLLARWQEDPATGRPPFAEGAAFVAFSADAQPL